MVFKKTHNETTAMRILTMICSSGYQESQVMPSGVPVNNWASLWPHLGNGSTSYTSLRPVLAQWAASTCKALRCSADTQCVIYSPKAQSLHLLDTK